MLNVKISAKIYNKILYFGLSLQNRFGENDSDEKVYALSIEKRLHCERPAHHQPS